MKVASQKTVTFGKRRVDYRLVRSKSAHKLRVRVGPEGVEVVQPVGRTTNEVESFIESKQDWIVCQLKRVERFRSVWKPLRKGKGEILYRGKLTPVRVEDVPRRSRTHKVIFEADGLVVVKGRRSRTSPAQSLENWLRKQARKEIYQHLDRLTARIGRRPRKVYVMDQRTKWGNCSSLQNLTFNWRLIMAPDFVLQYLVTHEAVHLAVPDHSKRFWLTVQSLCPEMERAKQWLCANGHKLHFDLSQVFENSQV